MNVSALKDLTRLEQTLFGLPFLLAAALLSFVQIDRHLLWIFPAFIFARVSGMAFNQLIDCKIDAKNPRTENRVIPSGRLSQKQAAMVAWSTLFLFVFVCFQINMFCFFLTPLVAFLLVVYSYLKRITASCHFVLGLLHFLNPIMVSIALAGTVELAPFLLGLAAAFLITGNDIVYAIQDYDFDREHNLFSLPARFGIKNSLLIARLVHLLCVCMLIFVGLSAHLPAFYYVLIIVTMTTLVKFHKKIGEKNIESAFFFCSTIVSFSVFSFILASVLWDAM